MKTIKFHLWVLLLPICIYAQNTSSESQMLQTFDNIIGLENTKLYNGKRYYNIYKVTKDNHNFYSASNFIKGDVYYDNAKFYNVSLKYDIYNDQLIFKPNGNKSFINIELIQDKVQCFNFLEHHFINSKTITGNNDLVTGYLEIIYKTPELTLYAKRKKSVTERIRSNKLVHLFYNTTGYYLYHKGSFNEVKSSKSFKKLFPQYNKDLKIEIKENKKRFEKDEEGLLVFLSQWIDYKLQINSTN